MKKKFYETNLFTILSLIIFFPVGIYLMFKNNTFTKPVRSVITVVFAALLVAGIFAHGTKETTPEPETIETIEEVEDVALESSEPLSVEDIVKSIGKDLILEVNTNDNLVVKMKFPAGASNSMSVTNAYLKAKDMIEKLLVNNYDFETYQFWFTSDLVDKYGNTYNYKVLSFTYDKETVLNINFKNITNDNFKSLSKDVYINPAVQ